MCQPQRNSSEDREVCELCVCVYGCAVCKPWMCGASRVVSDLWCFVLSALSDVLHSKHQHISGICMLMLCSPQRWMLWECVVHVAGAAADLRSPG